MSPRPDVRLEFRRIDIASDRDLVCRFRRDSYAVSFGDEERYPGDDEYIAILQDRIGRFPDGYVLGVVDGAPIGQLELRVIETDAGDPIGHANLFYLVPGWRGQRFGEQLYAYAMRFFHTHGAAQYTLHVAPQNARALRFYERHGMRPHERQNRSEVRLLIGAVAKADEERNG